ncbi:MAG: hypothetical protein QOI11_1615 [Candidatus Eremiobacteraeota bacterium]|jgi:hypothetical protein|nr:hypothetical protein [Candidatus Eremiobacteraeota bacterium]
MSAIVPNQNSTAEDDADVMRKARAALVARLARVVDISSLVEGEEGDGDRDFDFYLNVPTRELHVATQRISDVECDINEEFGVWVRVFAIPVGK